MVKDAKVMDARDYLLAQITALGENLRRADDIIKSSKIQGELRFTVQNRFAELIDIRKSELQQIHEDVKGTFPLDVSWNSYIILQKDCICIFRECLDFLEGALVRGAGLDDGICNIADLLLNQMADQTEIRWSRLTILGEREQFDQTAEIIRLKFPDFSIWTLPIIAHEFGHIVEQELKDLPPYQNIHPIRTKIDELAGTDANKRASICEFFSDLFGIYTMGPAFACTCILLRFNPLNAFSEIGDHPSGAKRVYSILRGLEKMGSQETRHPYSDLIEKLQKIWSQSLAANDPNLCLTTSEEDEQNEWMDKLYPELNKRKAAKYPASGWRIAENWFEEWDPNLKEDPDQERNLQMPAISPNCNIRDALNAAWLCRMYNPDKAKTISKATKSLCMAISAKGVQI
jgi:hypothetical protein